MLERLLYKVVAVRQEREEHLGAVQGRHGHEIKKRQHHVNKHNGGDACKERLRERDARHGQEPHRDYHQKRQADVGERPCERNDSRAEAPRAQVVRVVGNRLGPAENQPPGQEREHERHQYRAHRVKVR